MVIECKYFVHERQCQNSEGMRTTSYVKSRPPELKVKRSKSGLLVCCRAQTTNSPPLPFLSCENQPQTQSRREDKLEKVPSFINQRTQRRRRYCEGRPYCLSLSLRRGRRARPHAEICPFVAHRVATLANFTHCNRLRDAIELMRLGRHLACCFWRHFQPVWC